mgnify:CR=1 FL=1
MVEFYKVVSLFEVQCAPEASALLPLEEVRPSLGGFRVFAHSGGPVDPIAVLRAACAPNLGMPADGGVGVSPQGFPPVGFAGPVALA